MSILVRCVLTALACCAASLTAATEAAVGGAPSSAPIALVRKLDAIRLPTGSFVFEGEVAESRRHEAPRNLHFRFYSKASATSAGTFSSLIVMLKPAADANKLILMKNTKVWFYDPHSQQASVLSAKQLWQHTFVADCVTGRIEDQYDAKLVGHETLDTLENGQLLCAVIDLTPKGTPTSAAETVRYWLTEEGHPYQIVFFAASGKILRTCRFGGYAQALGALRPTRYIVTDRKGISTFQLSSFRPAELSDSLFDPANLSRLRLSGEPAR